MEETTPEALGAAVCDALHNLLGKHASIVSCSVLGQGRRGFAMVMLRDVSAGGFLSGTASSENHAEALVQAVLTALDLDDGMLAAIAEDWKALDGIIAVTVVDDGSSDAADAHTRLVRAMPAPGRLAVATEDAEYRVLRLPGTAVVVHATPGAQTLEAIDVWMAKAEALSP